MFQAPKLTDAGKALYYENIAGEQIVFTTIKLGSGYISGPIASMTALVNPVVTIDASARNNEDQYAEIAGHFSNAQLAEGFYWREIGVFAANPEDPDNRAADILYCYQNAYDTADFIPVASVETVEKAIIVPVIVGDAENISCVLSASLILATLKDLEDHNESESAHADLLASFRESVESDLAVVRGIAEGAASAASAAQSTANAAMEAAEQAGGGCVLEITFASAFAGQEFTVASNATGESYTGTVPDSLKASVTVKNCNTAYTITASTSGGTQYSTTATTGAYFGQVSVTLSTFSATLKVTTSAGAIVTATSGGNTYTATANSSGVATLTITQAGTYTVSATLNGQAAPSTASVAVTTSGSTYTASVPFVSTTLNNNDWATIKSVSDAGQGSNYWSAGATKTITINGTVAGNTFSNLSVDVFILGFNHNSGKEGNNRIHFQIGKISGSLVGLVASNYGNTGSGFCMNTSNTNSGGWNNSNMRKTVLGNSGTPSSPPSGSLLAALPADLRAVMKSVTKYSDNTGGGSDTASYVTSTTDYLFLLSEFEYHGARSYANRAEKNYQAQYAYYAANNSKVHNKHNATTTAAHAWCRSVHSSDSGVFCLVHANGAAASGGADLSYAVAPGFCV